MTDLGYYTGPIDGVSNHELTDSIKALQRDLGVPETGVFDAATLQAIYAQGILTGSTTTTTTPPETTAPPTTAPPVTATPTTAPPVTAPPTTAPPVTVPPVDPTDPTLQEALVADGRFTGYLRLLQAAGYPEDFNGLLAYTLFAPTDDALAAAGVDVDALIADDTPEELFALLSSTAAEGRLTDAYLRDPANSPLEMVSGQNFDLVVEGDGSLTINGSVIGPPEIVASNGIIHAITSLVVN
jgi:uncharacterized surface protein with fasciclin (FAS1) repeats